MAEEIPNDMAATVGIHQATQQAQAVANQNTRIQYEMEGQERSLADSQLECDETLEKIYHLLRQDSLKLNKDGILEWKEIGDLKKRVLTEEGVEKIMQIMRNYINKETLLSNFDDKTIARRMLQFSLAFNALMFMKYEVFFSTPTLEECHSILQERIGNKTKRIIMDRKLLKKEYDETQIEKDVLIELEPHMEYELDKIKQEKTKLNLREFEMIYTQLTALVEATHNRAWKGEERGSLRRHFNISEVIGGKPTAQPEKKSMWGFR